MDGYWDNGEEICQGIWYIKLLIFYFKECGYPCLYCSGSATYCTDCDEDRYLDGETCTCNDMTYDDGVVCVSCHYSCFNCTGNL